jgi:hypothetical protein
LYYGYIQPRFSKPEQRIPCYKSFCPVGSPDTNAIVCGCRILYPPALPLVGGRGIKKGRVRNYNVCIVTNDPGDDRPLQAITNAAELKSATFYSINYQINRLYAKAHGYRFWRPQLNTTQLQGRAFFWSIVQVLRRVVKDRRCKVITWIGSDAYFATSERIEDIIEPFGLLDDKDSRDFLFASTQTSPSMDNDWGVQNLSANLSTQFMTMRNTVEARNFLEFWWAAGDWPEYERFQQDRFHEQSVVNSLCDTGNYSHIVPRVGLPVNHAEFPDAFLIRHGVATTYKDEYLHEELRRALVERVLAPDILASKVDVSNPTKMARVVATYQEEDRDLAQSLLENMFINGIRGGSEQSVYAHPRVVNDPWRVQLRNSLLFDERIEIFFDEYPVVGRENCTEDIIRSAPFLCLLPSQQNYRWDPNIFSEDPIYV